MSESILRRINEYGRARLKGGPLLTADAWEESQHKRAPDGKFGAGKATAKATAASEKASSSNAPIDHRAAVKALMHAGDLHRKEQASPENSSDKRHLHDHAQKSMSKAQMAHFYAARMPAGQSMQYRAEAEKHMAEAAAHSMAAHAGPDEQRAHINKIIARPFNSTGPARFKD